MPEKKPFQLFAILHGKEEIRRLPLQQSLAAPVSELFEVQAIAFSPSGAEVLAFDPALRPAEDQIIRIPDFAVPASIQAAIDDPLSVDVLSFSEDTTVQIVGLFIGRMTPKPRVLLQTFNRRQMLTTKGFSLILSGDTFKQLTEPGLTLDDRLSAVIEGSDLLIRSYIQAARVLDLTDYYSEATDQEVAAFAQHERLYCEDVGALQTAADTWVRRKVALLAQSEVLKMAAKKIRDAATEFKLDIVVKKVGGKDKIVLPQDRQGLKNLLRFLDEDYYHSPLTAALFVSHSKQKLPGKTP